jgi:hypothetical protein
MYRPKGETLEERTMDVVNDPNNEYIPRIKGAGQISDGLQTMHNGIKIVENCYYGTWMSNLLKLNKGVHEPQEERVFQEVLKFIKPHSTMIELGAYWSFYSLWFYKTIKNATCIMVEPNSENLLVGKQNFLLNNAKGIFINDTISNSGITINDIMGNYNIDHVDILHSDIQSAEGTMLKQTQRLISKGAISYMFISTHGQTLHYECKEILEQCGCDIICSVDFDHQTHCYDGILVAKNKEAHDPEVNVMMRN